MLGEPRRRQPLADVAPERAHGHHQRAIPRVRHPTRFFVYLWALTVGTHVDSVSEEEASSICLTSIFFLCFHINMGDFAECL